LNKFFISVNSKLKNNEEYFSNNSNNANYLSTANEKILLNFFAQHSKEKNNFIKKNNADVNFVTPIEALLIGNLGKIGKGNNFNIKYSKGKIKNESKSIDIKKEIQHKIEMNKEAPQSQIEIVSPSATNNLEGFNKSSEKKCNSVKEGNLKFNKNKI